MRRRLDVPADRLLAVQRQITVCSRHGEPSVSRRRLVLQSRPALSGDRSTSGNLLSTTSRLAEHYQKVELTRFTDWPFCRRCVRTRRTWLTVSGVLFWGGLALIVSLFTPLSPVDNNETAAAVFFSLFAVLLFSVVPFTRGSVPRIMGARTSQDGTSVEFTDPHPQFVRQLERAGATSA